jgi:hypothetical protein
MTITDDIIERAVMAIRDTFANRVGRGMAWERARAALTAALRRVENLRV